MTSGQVKIYAPEGFLEAAVAENVMAGNAMSRRASYMYGNLLPPDAKGQVGTDYLGRHRHADPANQDRDAVRRERADRRLPTSS